MLLTCYGDRLHQEYVGLHCVRALRKKAQEVLKLWGERYPASQEPRNTTKAHCTTNLTQGIHREKHKVSASAEKQQGAELEAGLYGVSCMCVGGIEG